MIRSNKISFNDDENYTINLLKLYVNSIPKHESILFHQGKEILDLFMIICDPIQNFVKVNHIDMQDQIKTEFKPKYDLDNKF